MIATTFDRLEGAKRDDEVVAETLFSDLGIVMTFANLVAPSNGGAVIEDVTSVTF